MRKEITFTLDELKKRLDAENYARYPDFRRYVLEKAISDINAYSDLKVGYYPAYTSNRRATDSITFSIREPSFIESKVRSNTKRRELTATGKAETKVVQKTLKEWQTEISMKSEEP